MKFWFQHALFLSSFLKSQKKKEERKHARVSVLGRYAKRGETAPVRSIHQAALYLHPPASVRRHNKTCVILFPVPLPPSRAKTKRQSTVHCCLTLPGNSVNLHETKPRFSLSSRIQHNSPTFTNARILSNNRQHAKECRDLTNKCAALALLQRRPLIEDPRAAPPEHPCTVGV